MKNILLLTVAAVLYVIPTVASNRNVELKNRDHLDVIVGHPNSVPTVNEDGDEVTITCDSTINDVDIVIRDQYGTVMHQSTQTIGPNETTIYVPSTNGDSEKTTIDLYYDRKHLSGYFEE